MSQIAVTAEHIDQGKLGDPSKCPVALALREHFPDATISVLCDDMWIGEWTGTTPSEVAAFIDAFDHSLFVEPFEFELPF